MAVKYWFKTANGSDNWATATNWYNGSGGTGGTTTVPTSADDVIFDANSGTGTVTIAATATCNSFNATQFTGKLAGASNFNITNQTTRDASSSTPLFAFGSGMTTTYSGTVTFGGTTGLGGWIYCNGKSFAGTVSFNNTAVGATFTLQDAFTTTGPLTVTNGIVIAEDNVSCNDFLYGVGTKSFTCTNLYLTGTGVLNPGQSAANTTNVITNIIVNNSSATGKTLSFGPVFGSTNVELGGSGSGFLTLAPSTTHKPNVSVTNTGGAVLSISTGAITDLTFAVGTTAVWTNAAGQTLTMWGNLTFTPLQPNPTRTPALSFNQAVESNITMAGKALVTGAITINNPVATITFLDEFNCPLINVTITDSSYTFFKHNFTCAALSNGLSSYLYVEKNLTCTTLSASGGSAMWIGEIQTGGRNNSIVNISGGITTTGTGPIITIRAATLTCTNISIGTGGIFDCNTDTLGFPVTINCTSVTLTGAGTLNILSSMGTPTTFNCSGAFSTGNGNVQIRKSIAYFTTFTMSGAGSSLNMDELGLLNLSGVGTAFSMAAGAASVSAGVNSKIEFTNTSNSSVTFGGGSWVYHEVIFNRGASTGVIGIAGSNNFTNFRDLGTAAHTVQFSAGTTQYIGHFDVKGSPGNIITLTRSSSTATYVSKSPRGIVTCNYLTVTNLLTDDLNTWYAGPNSTVTNSANWVNGGDVRSQSALGVG